MPQQKSRSPISTIVTSGKPRISSLFSSTRNIALLGFAVSFVVGFYVIGSLVFNEYPSDFLAHIEIANQLGLLRGLISYSLFYPVQFVASFFGMSEFSSKLALVTLLSFAIGVQFLLSLRFLLSFWSSNLVPALLAVSLIFVMPIVDPLLLLHFDSFCDITRFSDVVIGQTPPNVWHNSTAIFLGPFAVGSAILMSRFWDDDRDKSTLIPSLVLLGSAAAKPSHAILLIPSVLLIMVLRRCFNRGPHRSEIVRFVQITCPAILWIGMQYFSVFQGSMEGGEAVKVVIKPFEQWRQFTANVWISVARSVAFPAVVTIVSLMYKRISIRLVTAWGTYLLGVIVFVLFSEHYVSGGPRLHGNFSWGLVPATYVLFLFSLAEWQLTKDVLSQRQGFMQIFSRLIVGAVYLIHIAVGVAYLFALANGSINYSGIGLR